MTIFLVSLITSTIVSSVYCFFYYRIEIRKQKEVRRRNWEIKKEELKEMKPVLFEKMDKIL